MSIAKPCRLAGVVLTVTSLAVAGSALARSPNSNEPVKLPIMQSSDFDFIVTVYGEVLKEAGYRVEYVNADYTASFPGVKAGDLQRDHGVGHLARSHRGRDRQRQGHPRGLERRRDRRGLVVPGLHRRVLPRPAGLGGAQEPGLHGSPFHRGDRADGALRPARRRAGRRG